MSVGADFKTGTAAKLSRCVSDAFLSTKVPRHLTANFFAKMNFSARFPG